MGTVLESDNIDVINDASKKMVDTVHNLGIDRFDQRKIVLQTAILITS